MWWMRVCDSWACPHFHSLEADLCDTTQCVQKVYGWGNVNCMAESRPALHNNLIFQELHQPSCSKGHEIYFQRSSMTGHFYQSTFGEKKQQELGSLLWRMPGLARFITLVSLSICPPMKNLSNVIIMTENLRLIKCVQTDFRFHICISHFFSVHALHQPLLYNFHFHFYFFR